MRDPPPEADCIIVTCMAMPSEYPNVTPKLAGPKSPQSWPKVKLAGWAEVKLLLIVMLLLWFALACCETIRWDAWNKTWDEGGKSGGNRRTLQQAAMAVPVAQRTTKEALRRQPGPTSEAKASL